jgi:hypothetical protein
MKVAQQLPVLLVECGRWPQANDEVLTYVREFSVGHSRLYSFARQGTDKRTSTHVFTKVIT